jgi:hypothetical protein
LLADTSEDWKKAGHNLNGGNPFSQGPAEDPQDEEDNKAKPRWPGRDISEKYGEQEHILCSLTKTNRMFYKVLHKKIYSLYVKLHKAYTEAKDLKSPGNDWKLLVPIVPEINEICLNISIHTQQSNIEEPPLTLYALMREWDLFWSGHDKKDVEVHLKQLWLREGFPMMWTVLPLPEQCPVFPAQGNFPSIEDSIIEWKRYYGCDEDGEILPPDAGTGMGTGTGTGSPDGVFYPAAQVVAVRLNGAAALAKIPPPSQGSKPWLATQSIPSHGFRSQAIKPQYTDEGQLIVAYKEYAQRGYDKDGDRLMRRIFVVKNELANGRTQYLIKSQAECGGGGVFKNLDASNTPKIDDSKIVDWTQVVKQGEEPAFMELPEGDWLRENSETPWEMPWAAMPPETAWDPETIPEMSVCIKFTIKGTAYTKVFHRSFLHKYIPQKGVAKAILRCFGIPEMPSLAEFFRQYHASRHYFSARNDLHHQRRAITSHDRSGYRSRSRSRTRSRRGRHVDFASDTEYYSDTDAYSSTDDDTDTDADTTDDEDWSVTATTSNLTEEEPPTPKRSKPNNTRKSKSNRYDPSGEEGKSRCSPWSV